MRTGDWIGFNCGDHVREPDGRHVGRVQAILSGGAQITVKWLDTGWISYFNRAELIVVSTYDQRQRLAATEAAAATSQGANRARPFSRTAVQLDLFKGDQNARQPTKAVR